MTQKQTVHIDLDKVLETLRRGVRRADVFMGMGLNAAEQNRHRLISLHQKQATQSIL